MFAGVENAVVEMAFTPVLDPSPDPTFFAKTGGKKSVVRGFRDKEILDLAMYEQDAGLKLMTQRSLWETSRIAGGSVLPNLDERWKVGS
jgi:hypothetical protein